MEIDTLNHKLMEQKQHIPLSSHINDSSITLNLSSSSSSSSSITNISSDLSITTDHLSNDSLLDFTNSSILIY